MLLTITTTHVPATDLGYLLHKHPARVQSFSMSFGQAHVFYPEAGDERCTAALLLEVDPIGLVRGRHGLQSSSFALEQYVNDRPYVVSSFMSVAIGHVFGSALGGRSKERPELVEQPLPLHAHLSVVQCHGGETLLRRLFEPLGYIVEAQQHPLDEQFPAWGESWYFTLGLAATIRLRDLLSHLYVLIPVLDNEKHYWVGEEEVEKLLRHGSAWLARHPERELITKRYLRYQRRLTRAALAQLVRDELPDPDRSEEEHAREEEALEERISLHELRLQAVLEAIKQSGATRVLDLGCGEGRLLKLLLADRSFESILGMDVSYRAIERARERLRLDRLPARDQRRLKLIQGSLIYADQRLAGYDAAAIVEVIEHLDTSRLAAFERVVFEQARPGTVVVTTPNREYNVRWETLPAGRFRHKDHRFEWTRSEFEQWARAVCDRFGYTVTFQPIGPEDPVVGAPSQMAIFQVQRRDPA
ncbi:MAG: 3' terminal RNA ribose 2'-O-methyltransferase Hen1 [Herpetosiphonaceae bacterium]|nr:MAG: 3' terminal RNA ribose 2'-O-methyltransferase Hen1 [Herpetosiphonaceae bacterium]